MIQLTKAPAILLNQYWTLPGPSNFMARISAAAKRVRATAISLPNYDIPGLWDKVKEGLENAHISKRPDILVSDGTNIEAEIGIQFDRNFMTAAQLAQHVYGTACAILLIAKDEQAAVLCDAYFKQFMNHLANSRGDVHLFIALRDGECTEDISDSVVQVLCFDGFLSPIEMQAYVTLRMIERPGPGSTSLLNALVVEYAGYDVILAEHLIGMSDTEILSLPESLTPLLQAEPMRWTTDSWVNGTIREKGEILSTHPLREWYLARNDGPRSKEMAAAARRRYWRACVRALTPWLEERRSLVLEKLKVPLDNYEKTYGHFARPTKNSERKMLREELEYNNIVGMNYENKLVIPSDESSQRAFLVCKSTKTVRDDLAHLRAPDVSAIDQMIRDMDLLFESKAS